MVERFRKTRRRVRSGAHVLLLGILGIAFVGVATSLLLNFHITPASADPSAKCDGSATNAAVQITATISGTTTLTPSGGSSGFTFTSADVGKPVTGPGVPSNTTIASISGNGGSATLSNAATNGSGSFFIGGGNARSLSATTSASIISSSPPTVGAFTNEDIGQPVSGPGIADGTTISSIDSAGETATLSTTVTTGEATTTFYIGGGVLDLTISSQATQQKPLTIGASGHDYSISVVGSGNVNSNCNSLDIRLYTTVNVSDTNTSSQYVAIDNTGGVFASQTAATTGASCEDQFSIEPSAPASGTNTVALLDDNTTPLSGDDSVAVASSTSAGFPVASITPAASSECAAADITATTLTSGSPVAVVVTGQPASGNTLDLSAGTSPLTINAQQNQPTGTGTPGTVTGLAGGVSIQFSGEQTILAPQASTSFDPGSASGITFTGNTGTGVSNTIDLSTEANLSGEAFTVSMGTQTGCTGEGEISATGGTAAITGDCFTNVSAVNGAPTAVGTTTVDAISNCTTTFPSVFFQGNDSNPQGSVLQLVPGPGATGLFDCPTSTLPTVTVAVNSDSASSSAAEGQVTTGSITSATFAGVNEIVAPSYAPTDFQPGSAGGVYFDGAYTPGGTVTSVYATGTSSPFNSTIDLSQESSSLPFNVSVGQDSSFANSGSLTSRPTGGGGSISDTFSGINQVLGSPGGTDFQPGTASGVTFTGAGTASGNGIDLSNEAGSSFRQLVAGQTLAPVDSTQIAGVNEPATSSTLNVNAGGFPGVVAGMGVSGTGIAGGTTVSNVSGNTATLSIATTNGAAQRETLTFTLVTTTPLVFDGLEQEASVIFDSDGAFNGVTDGMFVTGPGIPAGTTVIAGGGTDEVSLSQNVTTFLAPSLNTVAFSGLPPADLASTCATAQGSVVGDASSGGLAADVVDCFSDTSTVNGSPNVTTVFDPNNALQSNPATPALFVGNNTSADGSVLNLTDMGSANAIGSLTAELKGDTSASTEGQVSGTVNSTSINFASFYGVNEVLGSAFQADPTTFRPDTASAVDLVGQTTADTLDLSNESSGSFGSNGSFNVAMSSTGSPCTTSEGQLTSAGSTTIADCFGDIAKVLGSPLPLQTTFTPNGDQATSPYPVPTFVGGGGSTVDLSCVLSTESLTASENGTNQVTNPGGFPCVVAGMSVTGTGIPTGTTVSSVSGNTVTLSQVATQSSPESLSFGSLKIPAGTATCQTSTSTATDVVAGMNANTSASPASIVAAIGNGSAVTCLTLANFYSVNQVNGSNELLTDFQPATASGVTFAGGNQSNVLDLSGQSATNLVVAPNGNSSSSVGALSGAVGDNFDGISTVLGAPGGTTFQPGSSAQPEFVGACASSSTPNVVDLSSDGNGPISVGSMTTGGATVPTLPPNLTAAEASNYTTCQASGSDGQVSSGSGGTQVTSTFLSTTEVKGSTSVATTFQPGTSTGVTFVGQGNGLTNTLDLSSAAASDDVTMGQDSAGAPGAFFPCAVLSGSTPNVACEPSISAPAPATAGQGTFQQIEQINGSNSGTNFILGANGGTGGASGGVTLQGDGPYTSNTLFLPSLSTALTVAVGKDSSGAGQGGQLQGLTAGIGNSTTDSFSGIGTFNGSEEGAGGATFEATDVLSSDTSPVEYLGGGTGTNTLSLDTLAVGSTTPVQINIVPAMEVNNVFNFASEGGTNFAEFSGISHFQGCDSGTSACASTALLAGANTIDNYQGLGAANTLDYSQLPGPSGVSVTESSGSGTATPVAGGTDTFSGVQTFNGSPNGDIFTVGTGNAVINGGGGKDTATFTNDQQGITFTLSYDDTTPPSGCSSATTPSELATIVTANGTDCTTGINSFVGSSSGQNTFVSDGFGGHTFQAGGSGNSLDLSQVPSGSLSGVTINATGSCSPLPDCVTSLNSNTEISASALATEDLFSGIQTFDGAPGGTTFESNGTNGLVFNGNSASDVLDLSTAPSGIQVQDGSQVSSHYCNGAVISGASSESFSDIAQIRGSSNGQTTFVATSSQPLVGTCTGSTPASPLVTFVGGGSGNKLDISAVSMAANVIVPETGPPAVAGCVATTTGGTGGTANGCPASTSELETFSDVQTFVGASSGNTKFITTSTGGFTFTGQGSGNALSFADVASGSNGVQVFLNPNSQGLEVADPGTGTDTFTGITTIDGSPNADTFFGGPGNYQLNGGTGGATLNDSSASTPVSVSMSNGLGSVTGGFSGQTNTSNVQTFVGSSGGDNTFDADSFGGYNFQAPGGSTGNVLSFAAATSLTNPLTVSVLTNTGGGNATNLVCQASSPPPNCTQDSFQGIQSFTGSPESNAFSAGNGQFTFTTPTNVSGTESIDLSRASVGVAFTLNSATSLDTAGGTAISNGNTVDDTISGFTQLTGSNQGGNTFSAPDTGGYDLIGQRSSNTLDLSAVAIATPPLTVDVATGTVSSLSSGVGSASTDAFTGIQTFNGSAESQTTFVPGCSGGSRFNGETLGTILDLSQVSCSPTPSPTIDAAVSPGTLVGLGAQDTFTDITAFKSPTTGLTTFDAAGGSTAGLDFVGTGPDNTFDASDFPSGATLDDSAATGVATLTPGLTDNFSGVTCFVGSSGGGTTFKAPASALSSASGCKDPSVSGQTNFFAFPGSQPNVLNLSQIPSGASIDAPAGTITTSGAFASFSGMQSIIGSTAGDTTFVTGSAGGLNFSGQGTGNTLSFKDVSATGGGVQVFLNPNTQGQETANPGTGSDTFTGISSITGSQANDTFNAGPGTYSITGHPGDTLTYSLAPSAVSISLDNGTATTSGGFSGATTTTGVNNFIGSAVGGNTFDADSYGGYSFQAPVNSTNNALSYAGVETIAGMNGIGLNVNTSSGNGNVTGLVCQTTNPPTSCTSDSFSGIQEYTGTDSASLKDTFTVGQGAFSLTDFANGQNTLSFDGQNPPAGVTANLSAVTSGQPIGTVTSPGNQVNDTVSGFTTIIGAPTGNSDFETPQGGGYKFVGNGTSNTLDLSAAPSGISVAINGNTTTNPGSVTNLDSGVSSSTTDSFAGIQTFTGSTAATSTQPTTYLAGCSGGVNFNGNGRATTLELALGTCAGPTPSPTIDAATTPGSISGLPGGGGNDTFTGITSFQGAPLGNTTFIAPGSPNSGAACTQTSQLCFTGEGSGGNILDASAFPSGSVLNDDTGTATIGSSGQDSFTDVQCFVGATSGQTTFTAATTLQSSSGCIERAGQPNFLAFGNSNTLDLTNLTTGPTSTNTAIVNGGLVTLGAGTGDSYSDVQSFVGSGDGFTSFDAPAGSGFSFTGKGTQSTNSLSVPLAPRNTTVDTTAETVTLGGGTGTLTFADIGNFGGSSVGFTTFRPDALHSYGFTGVAGTAGNTLDLSNAPLNVPVDLACNPGPGGTETVIMVSRAATCTAPGSQTADTFAGIENLIGSQLGGTTFTAPSGLAAVSGSNGGLSFTGFGAANTLSFNKLQLGLGVTIDLNADTVQHAGWAAEDTFTDIASITGSPNADTFDAGPVSTSISGGGGSDTISFANANQPANITLPLGASQGVATGGFVNQAAQIDMTGIQNVVASPFGGTVTGNTLPSVLTGEAGPVDFVVMGGADVINGGGGSDTLDVSHANKFVTLNLGLSGPQVTGGAGLLTIVPGTITDVIGGNFGNRLIAGPGNVTLNGGIGSDWLQAGSGTDTLKAGSGTTTLVGGTGSDTMTGGAGSDTFIPGTGGGKIVDTAGLGTLDYALAASSVHVNIGNAQYTAPNGVILPPDRATGGGGAPELLQGLSNIIGTNHGDILVGSTGSNTIQGGNGTNLIVGDGGNDTLTSGSGTNVFITGTGDNTVIGGSGTNTIDYAQATKTLNVNLLADSAPHNGFGGTDRLVGITNIIGSSNDDDVLELGPNGGTIIEGNGNNDSLISSTGGHSRLVGGGGADSLTSKGPDDYLIGGGGADTFLADNGFEDFLVGGSGYNIAFVDCTDVKDHTFIQGTGKGDIEEVHAPSSCTAAAHGGPPRKPVAPIAGKGSGPVKPVVTPVKTTPVKTPDTKKTVTTTTKPVTTTRKPTTTTTGKSTTTTSTTAKSTTSTTPKSAAAVTRNGAGDTTKSASKANIAVSARSPGTQSRPTSGKRLEAP